MNPKQWPLTHPDIDTRWDRAVREEPVPVREPQGELSKRMQGTIEMHKDWLTKPNGHPDSPLMLVTSYPNYNTRSLEYCLTQDPSSKSMGILFTKLGRRRDAFHFDAFSRRIDMKPLRSEYPAVASRSNSKTPPMSSDWTRNYCSGGGVEFRELSGNLLRYWTAFALEMWRRSTHMLLC
jgi:hypothetical protein